MVETHSSDALLEDGPHAEAVSWEHRNWQSTPEIHKQTEWHVALFENDTKWCCRSQKYLHTSVNS